VLRQALFGWAFNPATRDTEPSAEIAAALDWAGRASLPLAELEDTATVRPALGACARNLTGKPAAGSTQRRKRSVFYNALGYAVEQGHLPSNPVDRIQWTTPAVAQTVDRRSSSARPRPGPSSQPSGACPAGGSIWKRLLHRRLFHGRPRTGWGSGVFLLVGAASRACGCFGDRVLGGHVGFQTRVAVGDAGGLDVIRPSQPSWCGSGRDELLVRSGEPAAGPYRDC
jgi:hypothetical protein